MLFSMLMGRWALPLPVYCFVCWTVYLDNLRKCVSEDMRRNHRDSLKHLYTAVSQAAVSIHYRAERMSRHPAEVISLS